MDAQMHKVTAYSILNAANNRVSKSKKADQKTISKFTLVYELNDLGFLRWLPFPHRV